MLGAYPSALHVSWRSPDGSRAIRAIPVDDEPSPFWTGDDEDALVDAWKATIGYDPTTLGVVAPAGNGTSGRTLDMEYLEPLGVTRADTWITDCVDTYFVSDAARKRLPDVDGHCRTIGLPVSNLANHPTDRALVEQATTHHRERLRAELETAAPATIITLGDVAATVLMTVLDLPLEPSSLARVPDYGKAVPLESPVTASWLRLAHPRALRTKKWAARHQRWRTS